MISLKNCSYGVKQQQSMKVNTSNNTNKSHPDKKAIPLKLLSTKKQKATRIT